MHPPRLQQKHPLVMLILAKGDVVCLFCISWGRTGARSPSREPPCTAQVQDSSHGVPPAGVPVPGAPSPTRWTQRWGCAALVGGRGTRQGRECPQRVGVSLAAETGEERWGLHVISFLSSPFLCLHPCTSPPCTASPMCCGWVVKKLTWKD